MAQLVGGVVGAVVGFYIGGPTGAAYGFSIGSAIGGALADKPNVAGPRLDDLKLAGTDYGKPISFTQGAPRLACHIWWASDRREISNTTEAGKGGGPTSTSFTYEIDLMCGLTDNEIGWVSRIWSNGKLVYNVFANADGATINASATTDVWRGITIYTGSATQLPDPTYEAAVGATLAPAYRGRSYAMITGLKLGSSGQLPNLTFEIAKDKYTAGGQVILLMQFDGNFVDSSSLAQAFTATGSTTTTTDARFVQSLDVGGTFPGGGGTNRLSSNASRTEYDLNAVDFTMECFVRHNGVVPGNTRALISFTSATQFEYSLGLTDGGSGVRPRIIYPINGAGGTNAMDAVGIVLAANTWYHVAASRSGAGTYRIFVDGILRNTSNDNARGAAGAKVAYIGNGHPALNGSLSGLIDSVRVISGAAFYTADFTPPAAPLGDIITLAGTTSTVTLQAAVTALCGRAGMSAGQFDASGLAAATKAVRSLAVSQVGPTRATLEQMQTAYFFECSLSDKLYFRLRAGSAVATIPFADLAAGVDEAAPQPLALTMASDLELPAQVAVQYSNVSNDHQDGVEYSDRLLTGQASTSTVSLALGFTPAEAKGIADAVIADSLASLTTTTISLPLAYAALEAADVVTVVDEDGVTTYRLRLTRKTEASGVLTFDAVVDDAAVVVSAQITDTNYTPSSTVSGLVDTVLLALDIPLLRDADDGPGYYVAARGATATWPGCVVMSSSNDVDYATVATVNESAVLGTCTTTLGNWSGGYVMDELNSVTVTLAHGEISSTTRDSLLTISTENTMLIGSEVIRFVTATLLSTAPNIYKLTRLLRGQRGTEWAMTGHAASERAVLLRPQGLRHVTQQASETGQLRYLKGVTNGKSAADVASATFTNTNLGQKPFAPVDLRGTRSTAGDMALTWKRRTRLSYILVGSGGMVAPLGETPEAYQVEIWNSTYTTLKRTITGLLSAAATYTAAQQATDFGAIQSTIYAKVYQMSAAVGLGYALTGSAAQTLSSYFSPLTSGDQKSPTVGVGAKAIVQRRGTSGGSVALGLYALTVGGSPTLSTFAVDAAATPYLLGQFGMTAVNPAGGRAVLYLRAQTNPQALRRILAGTPDALLQVADGSPGFMPTDPPAGIAWTGTKWVLITVSRLVYHSTDGEIWVYQGPISTGAPLFDPSPAGFNGAYMRMVAGVLVMRYGSDIYFNTAADGITWLPATGAVAALPPGTYTKGFQLYSLAASASGDVGVIIGHGRDAINTLGGVVYYSTDGMAWTELFNGEVAGPAWGARSGSFNAGMAWFSNEFLTDIWPLTGGSSSEDILTIGTAGGDTIKFNRRACDAAVTDTGLVAAGNGTIDFSSDTLYTSPDGVTWTPVTWSD